MDCAVDGGGADAATGICGVIGGGTDGSVQDGSDVDGGVGVEDCGV